MNGITADMLGQFDSDTIQTIVVIGVIALSVLGNIANSIIKNIKEKKERQQQLNRPRPPASTGQRPPEAGAFPTARPRPTQRDVARPLPPVARPSPPLKPTPPPVRQAQPPQPPSASGIPRELLPEGLEDVIAEMVPQLVRPKKRPRPAKKTKQEKTATRSAAAPPPQRAKKPVSQRPADSATRLGTLTSSFEGEPPRESSVTAHVESHISHLKHPVDDATIGTSAYVRRIPSRAALRHAIIMNEILSPPRALRGFDDPF